MPASWREKTDARAAVTKAVRKGALQRPELCEDCRNPPRAKWGSGSIEAHHEDYSRPLEVVWLCAPCHVQRHYGPHERRTRVDGRFAA
jgi:hypothetical protein